MKNEQKTKDIQRSWCLPQLPGLNIQLLHGVLGFPGYVFQSCQRQVSKSVKCEKVEEEFKKGSIG